MVRFLCMVGLGGCIGYGQGFSGVGWEVMGGV